ncbi:hypothetical protein SAMN06265337_0903 [Hymenobacter gelipurpurascens]|uniref:Uncharacterized protein n=1 Tax=Hymenobacter gelipurpurascens TaxID=89968 RepID=A0A212TCL0_9BACT|nr:hypothetical protein [Hymenobacter gelipurpurascens]SNC63571.1 hypothetical protein SAMN06265337_0903 [Hymenobacter gelipurpurascens]
MKTLATILLMCALYSTGNAQAAPTDGSKLHERAKTLTRQMAEKLPLSEGQYVKVRQLNLRLLTETADVRQRLASDATGLDEAMADIQMRYEWDLAAVLRPRQMAVYDQNKVTMTAVNLK